MNNRNVILCSVNAQATTGYSRREFVALISDGSSATASNNTAANGRKPPHPLTTQD